MVIKKRKMKGKITVKIISYLLIVLFVYAGVSKLLAMEKFIVQIGQSPMLTNYALLVAWFVPVIELVIAALLMFEKTQLTGLYLSASLMTMFTVYIILASRFSDYVPCSCGGVIETLTWSQHLVFNFFFLGGAILGVMLDRSTEENVIRPQYETKSIKDNEQ